MINTMLATPNRQVLNLLFPGQILEVKMFAGSVMVYVQDEIVGGVASPLVHRLRECLLAGTRYQAKVVAKNEALVRLQISAVSIYS